MNPNPLIKSILLGFIFTLIIPVTADEDPDHDEGEEVQMPTRKETLQFLSRHVPLAVEMLEQVKEEEEAEDYEEVLEELREQHHEYLEILHLDGQETATLYLEGVKIELRMDHALHTFHDDDLEKKQRAKLREQVEALVREQYAHDRKVIAMEIKLMEENLKALKAELVEFENIGEDTIKKETAELLNDEEDSEDEEDR